MKTLALVGPGRVGQTLAGLLSPQQFRIGPVLSRDWSAARRAVREMKIGWPTASYDDLGQSDWILVAVPEAQTRKVLERIAQSTFGFDHKVVLSTSGLCDPAAFEALHRKKASTGVIYPLQVFQRPKRSLAGVHFIVSGDPQALKAARSLARAVGGRAFQTSLETKDQALVAASIAADGVTGLLELAAERMTAAGLPRKSALEALRRIVEASFDDYVRSGRRSRPGALLQGDAEAVERRSEICRQDNPQAADLYRSAMRLTLDVFGNQSEEFAFLRDPDQPGRLDPDPLPVQSSTGSQARSESSRAG